MNKRQKSTVFNFVIVLVVTLVFSVAMVCVKDVINQSESMRTMKLLAEAVQQHRKEVGSLPSKSYFENLRQKLQDARLGECEYRARWIGFEAEPDTILAYAWKDFHLPAGRGYVVMRLDGSVEWMKKKEFEKLLSEQQNEAEIKLLQKPNRL